MCPIEKLTQTKYGRSSSLNELSEDEIVKSRLCDLGLQIDESSAISHHYRQLCAELDSKGLTQFRPRIYLGDEWFSPEGEPEIAIPFIFADQKLIEIERKHLFEVEGEDSAYFMKLLRHESGHAFDHAFKLSRQKKWRKLFGSPDQDYDPDHYRPKPYSRAFVRNLDNWYAQSHPEEDFAETFATWLNPASDWKKQYARWPVALSKLNYIDEVSSQFKAIPTPSSSRNAQIYNATRMRMTFGAYLNRKKKSLSHDAPDFYDDDLRRIFLGGLEKNPTQATAVKFLKRRRKQILETVSHWTREKKFTIERIVARLEKRCADLELSINRPEDEVCLDIAAYLATLMTHYFFTGSLKGRP